MSIIRQTPASLLKSALAASSRFCTCSLQTEGQGLGLEGEMPWWTHLLRGEQGAPEISQPLL